MQINKNVKKEKKINELIDDYFNNLQESLYYPKENEENFSPVFFHPTENSIEESTLPQYLKEEFIKSYTETLKDYN